MCESVRVPESAEYEIALLKGRGFPGDGVEHGSNHLERASLPRRCFKSIGRASGGIDKAPVPQHSSWRVLAPVSNP